MTPDAQPPSPSPETPAPIAADWLAPRRFARVLAALLAVTFWRVLFGGEAFFYRDYGFLGYPFAHFHRECFWNGDFFPLWNPYVNCGAPFLAQWNTLCLYPGALIYLLLPLPWSLGFFCVAHLFLGGMGMRALAERWTGNRFGAAVAGVAFVFSGLVLGCVIYPNYLVALGWMPWVALATRRAWQEGGRSLVLAALAGAMQMLSGAPEIILLTWGFLAALMLVEGKRKKEKGKSAEASETPDAPAPPFAFCLLPFAFRFTAVALLIAGLCAAQLLPYFQLLSLSQRSGDVVNTFWSLPGWGWVNLFFPLFMNFQTEQGVFVMIGQSFFPSVYLGIVPLTLALLAVWRVRTPEVKLLGAATLLAVLLAMGDKFVLWRWLREVLPLGVMRFPVKALLLAAFTVPLLAAWGVKWLCNEQGRCVISSPKPDEEIGLEPINAFLRCCVTQGGWDVLRLCFGCCAVALIVMAQEKFWPVMSGPTRVSYAKVFDGAAFAGLPLFGVGLLLYGRNLRWQQVGLLGMLTLMAMDVVRHAPAFNPTIPAHAFQPGLALAYHADKGALTPAPKLGESRIMLSPLAERALHTRMVPKFYDDFVGQRLAFWGNLNLLDGLPKVNGASTLVTREWNDVEYFLYGTTNPAPANLMDFLGVTHTTKPGELMQWERRTNAMPLVSAEQRPVEYHRNSNEKPVLLDPGWNPREVVFTEHQRGAIYVTNQVPVSIQSVRFHLEWIEAQVDAAAPSVLVVAQNDYLNWRATVNGAYTRMERANHAFQAIPIPAGKSTVRLDYVDWPFRIGAGISLLTLLGCALLWRGGKSPG
ncbi:MAG: YfhO family protein [Limisphaerales bacterium]